jgi:cytochrome b561/polyisoprenoid-binding protein YceI
LLLSLLRLLWRLFHPAPAHPPLAPRWEKIAANLAHMALYALLLLIPLTGWIMVSASPLNLPTLLFNVIPWPHLPLLSELPGKAEVSASFRQYHEIAGDLLILILLAHIGAAMKHHLVNRDDVLHRMAPDWSSPGFRGLVAGLFLVVVVLATALDYYQDGERQQALLVAGGSEISFIADLGGNATAGVFTESEVVASLDINALDKSTLKATVQTATLSSTNKQVESSLPDADWFAAEEFPEAVFQSIALSRVSDTQIRVAGEITLKGNTQKVEFPMYLTTEEGKQIARGEFVIDRRDFNVGMNYQPTEDNVSFDVQIKFRFGVGAAAE